MVRRSDRRDRSGGQQPQRPQAGGGIGPVGSRGGSGQRPPDPPVPRLSVAPRGAARSDRGWPLIELFVVTVLATLGMFGIVFFYLSSQATWLDGSTQAISQREASVILGALTDSLRTAASASVFNSPDSLHQGISIKNSAGTEFFRLWWNGAESLVHEKTGGGSDLVAVVAC